jgi:hypothetical protein
MSIRDGLLVGDDTVSQYDGDPNGGPSLPLSSTQSSQINAEFVYRGSAVAPTNRITLPASIKETQSADAVESCVKSMQSLNIRDAMDRARALWTELLDAKSFPTDEQIIRLIANLQFPTIRDQLMADIPGIDEPMDRVLLAQTDSKPHWSRVEWAEQLLLHAYTRSSTRHSAPILTAIAFSAAPLPVRAHDLQDLDPFLGQCPGKLRAIAAGAFHSDGDDRSEAGDELEDFPVAGPHRQEFLVGQVRTCFEMTAT